MRIVFMGTPESAVPSLRRCLEDGHEVLAVWSQPDRPAGRGKHVAEGPIKTFAVSHNLPIEQPARIKTAEAKNLFASYQADLAVVVAYGRILPPEFLRAPKHGCVNVHFSLLPKYRGAAPVNWAIVNGAEKTGVTTMLIEEELDAGPILLQHKTPIGNRETATELMNRLAAAGAELLGETLARFDSLAPRSQDNEAATFAPLLKRDDGVIDWSSDASAIERRVRGFQPWPNAFTAYKSERLIIWRAEQEQTDSSASTGEVIAAGGDELIVKCGDNTALRMVELQPEARRRMSAREFLNGTHLKVGDRFGQI